MGILFAPVFPIKHPVPGQTWRHNKGESRVGYWHMPLIRESEDVQLDQLTEDETFEGKYLRIVAGRDEKGLYSRPIDSFITLDNFSIGLAHMLPPWFGEDLAEFVAENWGLATYAWGERGASCLLDKDCLKETFEWRRPKLDSSWKYHFDWPEWWNPDWDGFVAGWYEIARHPKVLRWYVDHAFSKLRFGVRLANKLGFRRAANAAAIARFANSYGRDGAENRITKAIEEVGYPGDATEDELMEYVYKNYYNPKGGGRIDRLEMIWDQYGDTPLPEKIDLDNLRWDADVVRVDGTVPRFIELELNPSGEETIEAPSFVQPPVPRTTDMVPRWRRVINPYSWKTWAGAGALGLAVFGGYKAWSQLRK